MDRRTFVSTLMAGIVALPALPALTAVSAPASAAGRCLKPARRRWKRFGGHRASPFDRDLVIALRRGAP